MSTSSSSRTQRDRHERQPSDIKDALKPLIDASGRSLNRMSVISRAFLAPFTHSDHRPEPARILSGLAPSIMKPHLIGSASNDASTSSAVDAHESSPLSKKLDFAALGRAPRSIGLGTRRITSKDLEIEEATSELLDAEVPDPDGLASEVSLLRGFNATIPSSGRGKSRRRKTREVHVPAMGLKKMGMSARGLLSESDTGEGDNRTDSMRRNAPRGRRGRESLSATVKLGKDELVTQKREILQDKENLQIRRSLIDSEISEISSKIQALDAIRERLQHDLLKLQEDELELDDELDGVRERLQFEEVQKSSNLASQSTVSRSSRRKKGPAFLPSEHDDLPPGLAFMTLHGHNGALCAVDFSEPYGVLVSAALDDSTRVWDLCTGDEIGRLLGHAGTTKCLQVEDTVCVTGGTDSTIRVWDLRLLSEEESRPSTPPLSRIDEDGEDFAHESGERNLNGHTTSIRQSVELESPNTCARVLEGHTRAITTLYFEEDSLVTGASDKTIRQWDLTTGQCVLTMDILWAISHPAPTPYRQNSTSLYSDGIGSGIGFPGQGLLSAASGVFAVPTPPYADGTWDMYEDYVGGVQFWGHALVSGSGDGGVRMWDMRTGQAHRTLLAHTAPVTSVQFDEHHIVSGSLDKTIRVWDLRTGGISDTVRYDYPVTSLQFDSRKIITCAGENGIKIYNRTTMQHSTLTTNGHTKPVERLRYMDRYLVSGGKDSTIKVWAL